MDDQDAAVVALLVRQAGALSTGPFSRVVRMLRSPWCLLGRQVCRDCHPCQAGCMQEGRSLVDDLYAAVAALLVRQAGA